MIKRIARVVAEKFIVSIGAEHYVVLIRTHDARVFILEKEYFGGSNPVRLPPKNKQKFEKLLVKQVFVKLEGVIVTSIPSKGLAYKTVFLVCDLPENWDLSGLQNLGLPLCGLDQLHSEEPRRAQMLDRILAKLDSEKQKAA